MTKVFWAGLLALVCLAPLAGAQTAAIDSLFRVAQERYDDGRFDDAELYALRGLREAEVYDELDKLRFHVLLGYIYVARDQRDVALKEFAQVLEVNPAFEPDPVQTSPKIMEVFREAKADHMLRVASEPAVFRMPQADARMAASWRSLVLPGWGQYYKKQSTKGAAIAAAQLFSLIGLAVMQGEVNRTHDDYQRLKAYGDPRLEDSYQDYRNAWQMRNITGYVALGIYALNYLDALYTPVQRKR